MSFGDNGSNARVSFHDCGVGVSCGRTLVDAAGGNAIGQYMACVGIGLYSCRDGNSDLFSGGKSQSFPRDGISFEDAAARDVRHSESRGYCVFNSDTRKIFLTGVFYLNGVGKSFSSSDCIFVVSLVDRDADTAWFG